MGLFMNKQLEPKIYKTQLKLKDSPNQNHFHVNYLEEFMKEQQKLNGRLTNSYERVNSLMKTASTEQHNHFNTMLKRMDRQEVRTTQFINKIKNQETPIQTILERMQKLDSIQQTLAKDMEQDELINQAIMDQLSAQDQAINKLAQKIEAYEEIYQEMSTYQKEQTELYQELIQNLQLQEAFHQTVLEQLNKQEIVTQGISTQIEHIKEMIVEKVTTILEKIESTYKTTSNYLFSFFTKPSPKLLEEEQEIKEEINVN